MKQNLQEVLQRVLGQLEKWISKRAARNVWRRWGVKGKCFALSYYAVRNKVDGHCRSSQHYREGFRNFYIKELGL